MKMKIVYVTPSLYWAGGLERVITLKANYLSEQYNYDVYIILTDGKNKKPYFSLSSNLNIINLDINFDDLYGKPLWRRVILYFLKQYIFKRRLTTCLKKLNPDITVSTLRREINFINSIRDGSIKIGEIHVNRINYREFSQEKIPIFLKKLFGKLWMKQLISKIRKLDKFVVLTNEDKHTWNEIDSNKILTIHNPTSFSSLQSSSCEEKRVIAVGRYTYQKGFDLLVEAWKLVVDKHPDWSLHVYGEGNRAELEKRVNELDLNKSFMVNGRTDSIIEKYLESSIFVLSSRYEGFGMVLTEAMSCGVPPVSFACPSGPRDIITHGVDGLLVENGNIHQLAENICILIENKDLRKVMGGNARESVKRFRKEEIMAEWKQLFEELMSSRS